MPQKKWNVDPNGAFGSPLRPKNHVCHGTIVEMHGTPRRSHASDTGLTVSAVAATSIERDARPQSGRRRRRRRGRGPTAESATMISTLVLAVRGVEAVLEELADRREREVVRRRRTPRASPSSA